MQRILRVIFYVLALLIPFGELARITLPHAVSIRLLDTIVAILVVGTIVRTRANYISAFKENKGFLVLSLILVASHLWSIQYSTLSSVLYLVRTLLYFQLPLTLGFILPGVTKKNMQLLAVIMSFILVASSLVQYFLYPPLQNLLYLGFDPHYYRAVGLLLDPNLIGILFVFIILYFINRKKTPLTLFLLGITLISILLTFSRISFLCLGIGLFFLLIHKKLSSMFVFVCIAGMAFLFILIPKQLGEGNKILRTNSINAKSEAWHLGIKLWKTNPLLGIGFNNSQLYKPTDQRSFATITVRDNSFYGLDSTVLTLLVTTGIIGIIGYFLLFRGLLQTHNALNIALILAFLLHTFSTNSFFTPTIFVFFLILYQSIEHRLL